MAEESYRNARYNADGTIDVEINHAAFGWIPFTASPNDPEEAGRNLFETLKVAQDVGTYVPPVVVQDVPETVSARQFKLQLLASGLLEQVEAFIAGQGQAVQIAYDNSGSFVRSEPMMQAGFAELGFSDAQIDAFFVAAYEL